MKKTSDSYYEPIHNKNGIKKRKVNLPKISKLKKKHTIHKKSKKAHVEHKESKKPVVHSTHKSHVSTKPLVSHKPPIPSKRHRVKYKSHHKLSKKKKKKFIFISEAIFILLILSFIVISVLSKYNGDSAPVSVNSTDDEKIVISISIDSIANKELNVGYKNQIEELLKEGFSIVVPMTEFNAKPGDEIYVGLGFTNKMDVITNFQGTINGVHVRYDDANYGRIETENWIIPDFGPFHMVYGKSYITTLKFTVPNNAKSGNYVFDMYMCYEDSFYEDVPDAGCNQRYNKKYSQTKKIYVTVV
ncbi:hypothetical protein HOD20_09375 [archaeon]|jgi:hypothetical protein|nr:hypothetical protein [archaeon]MBT4648684.1 hypothetical protein [archaeon]MBT6821808.1 hypothetical protein [archaeon]MBT7393082.1 hypothetical protein [archaeon]